MGKWIRPVIGLVGLIEALGAGYEYVRLIATGGVSMIGSTITIGPAVWFALAGGGIAIVSWASWHTIRWAMKWATDLFSPSRQLANLHNEIENELKASTGMHRGAPSRIAQSRAVREALAFKLYALNIPAPQPATTDNNWCRYLSLLLGFAKTGRIEAARRIGVRGQKWSLNNDQETTNDN